jgi:DNA mismatch repair ATPase MutS
LFGNNSLFQYINRTSTLFGKNLLADWFNNHLKNKDLIEKRQEAVRELAPELRFRQRFRILGLLYKGDISDGEKIKEWAESKSLFKENRFFRTLTYIVPAVNFIILANLNKSTEGLLKTSFGVKKSDIYKEEIFSELSDKEKKVARKKFRNTILSLSESLTQEKDKTRLEKLKKAFLDFYKQVYKVNDFSLSSVCSENMKETNKEILKKALQIVKK